MDYYKFKVIDQYISNQHYVFKVVDYTDDKNYKFYYIPVNEFPSIMMLNHMIARGEDGFNVDLIDYMIDTTRVQENFKADNILLLNSSLGSRDTFSKKYSIMAGWVPRNIDRQKIVGGTFEGDRFVGMAYQKGFKGSDRSGNIKDLLNSKITDRFTSKILGEESSYVDRFVNKLLSTDGVRDKDNLVEISWSNLATRSEESKSTIALSYELGRDSKYTVDRVEVDHFTRIDNLTYKLKDMVVDTLNYGLGEELIGMTREEYHKTINFRDTEVNRDREFSSELNSLLTGERSNSFSTTNEYIVNGKSVDRIGKDVYLKQSKRYIINKGTIIEFLPTDVTYNYRYAQLMGEVTLNSERYISWEQSEEYYNESKVNYLTSEDTYRSESSFDLSGILNISKVENNYEGDLLNLFGGESEETRVPQIEFIQDLYTDRSESMVVIRGKEVYKELLIEELIDLRTTTDKDLDTAIFKGQFSSREDGLLINLIGDESPIRDEFNLVYVEGLNELDYFNDGKVIRGLVSNRDYEGRAHVSLSGGLDYFKDVKVKSLKFLQRESLEEIDIIDTILSDYFAEATIENDFRVIRDFEGITLIEEDIKGDFFKTSAQEDLILFERDTIYNINIDTHIYASSEEYREGLIGGKLSGYLEYYRQGDIVEGISSDYLQGVKSFKLLEIADLPRDDIHDVDVHRLIDAMKPRKRLLKSFLLEATRDRFELIIHWGEGVTRITGNELDKEFLSTSIREVYKELDREVITFSSREIELGLDVDPRIYEGNREYLKELDITVELEGLREYKHQLDKIFEISADKYHEVDVVKPIDFDKYKDIIIQEDIPSQGLIYRYDDIIEDGMDVEEWGQGWSIPEDYDPKDPFNPYYPWIEENNSLDYVQEKEWETEGNKGDEGFNEGEIFVDKERGEVNIGGNTNAYTHINGDDYKINFNVELGDNPDCRAGYIFNYIDSKNYYKFTLSGGQQPFKLVQVTNGVERVVATPIEGYFLDPGSLHNVDIQIVGDKLVIYTDGRLQYDLVLEG